MNIIYYSDGSVYHGLPEDAPKRGVQAILQPNDKTRGYHAIQQGDYYLWRDDWGGVWQASDKEGMLFYMLDPGWKIVLFGETVSNSVYAEITKKVLGEMRRLNTE